jgi:4-amino-4-deoxy-L-arabinose transferase-like glycosyltransferase
LIPPLPRAARILSYAIGVLGVAWLCACIAPRVQSVWPLEWMEGASLEHARRLLHGEPIYAAPSGEFIPFMYPPLSYLPLALGMALFGPSLVAARCVMLVALAVSLLAIARAAAQLGGRHAGWLAAGFYALGYGYSGGFLDVVRVDGVFMALILLGSERLAARRDTSALVWFTLACFAKQHGVFFLAAASAFLLTCPGPRPLGRVLGSMLGLGVGFAAIEWWSGGWFSTYVVSVPHRHGLVPVLLLSFVGVDLGVYLPVLCGLALVSVLRHRRALRACDWLLLAGVLASALGRAHPGGDDNVRLPAYAMLVWVAVLGFGELAKPSRALLGLCAAVLIQALMLVQAPSLYSPDAAGERAFVRLHAELQRCANGRTSVALDHTRLTGTAFMHSMAWFDLVRNGDALGQRAQLAAARALQGRDAPAAIALSAIALPLRAALAGHYVPCAVVEGLRPPTGYAPGKTQILRRADQPAPAQPLL